MINALEELLSTVRKEATIFHAISNRQQNWTLPAVKAPVEILRRIFEDVCSPDATIFLRSGSWGWEHDMDFTQMVRQLRRDRQAIQLVCSRWRDVVVEDQMLWAQVVLRFSPAHQMPSAKRLETELARSGGHELSSYLSIHPSYDDTTKFLEIQALYNRTIHLNISAWCNVKSLLFADLPKFSNARTLRLAIRMVHTSASEQKAASIDLTPMQHLRELVIDIFDSSRGLVLPLVLRAPRSCGITRLTLWSPLDTHISAARSIDVSTSIALLNSCPYLEKLDWSSSAEGLHEGQILNVESQQHLTELSIAGDLPLSFLPMMHYPNLLRFRIHDLPKYVEDEQVPATVTNVHELLATTTKFPKLLHLNQRFCMHPERIIPFLRSHPGLEELVLWCGINEAWVVGLTALPSLSRIWIGPCHECAAPRRLCPHSAAPHIKELLQRLNSRQNTSQPVTVCIHPRLYDMNSAQLAAVYHNRDGLTVEEREYPNTHWYRQDYG